MPPINRRHVIPHRSFFTRRQDNGIAYHLHIRERGDPQINRHVHFRDYLIHHPEDATAYAVLKLKLATRFINEINKYVFGKDELIQKIDKKAKLWSNRKQGFETANHGEHINNWSKEKIIKAMEANFNVHLTHFAQYISQMTLVRIPGYTVVRSGLQDEAFNCVIEADFSRSDADKKIQEIMQYFAKDKVLFSWWLSPYDKPDDLARRLEKAGFMIAENHIGMAMNLDDWQPLTSPIKCEIIKAVDKKALQDFAKVSNNPSAPNQYYDWVSEIVTEEDPIEFYVCYINNKPVARGQLVYFGMSQNFRANHFFLGKTQFVGG